MSRNTDTSKHQLPKTVVPRHYTVLEQPDMSTFRFTGSVTADIEVHEPVDKITLHSLGLKITRAYVVQENGTRLNALQTPAKVSFINPDTGESKEEEFSSAATLDDEKQTATFAFAETVGAGSWKFIADFEGSLVQPSFEGFHRCGYKGDDGQQKWALSTQFEATHLRRALPCWDEPELKATYDITLVVDHDQVALSNGRPVSETVKDGKKTVKFATTAKQSTYLIAWSIGDFESSKPVFANGKEIRVWSTPGKNHIKDYALKCAEFAVPWFERKFDVPYFGGDKIDLIAIPEFRSGAMENTGLITFRATALLVDEAHATVGELQRVAEVIFHELAHQWFGNLVTMAWWDGLPLNESNATIFGYLVMDDFCPEWDIFDSFGLDRAGAFALDSLGSTHPCWAPVGHPDEVEERFDQISYEKGGSLELQILRFIGVDNFYRGCHNYLTRFSHGNAEVTDLWDAIEEGAKQGGLNVPVRQIMDAWFLQSGHPVVTVSAGSKPGTIKLEQERFAFLADASYAGQLWPIPVHLRYATADGTIKEDKLVFSTREQEVEIGEGFQWIAANAGGFGFYRVRYATELLNKLLGKPFENLQVIERFNLVNDSWALVRAQKLSATTYLDLVKKLSSEKDANVWSIIGGALQALHSLTSNNYRTAFKQLIRELVKPIFTELGWTPKPGESSTTLELRGSLACLLGTVGEDAEVQTKAVELFDLWKKDRKSIDPNVVPALVATLAYTGDNARFDEFVSIADAASTDQEKLRFLGALGGFRKAELYNRAITMMLEQVKTDDAPYLLGAFLRREHAAREAWDTLRANWEKVVKRFPSSGVVRMVGCCSDLDTTELQAEVKEFFAAHKVAQGDMAVAQMLERLSVNVRLRQTETPRLQEYLCLTK